MGCSTCSGAHNDDYHDVVEVSRISFATPECRVDIVKTELENEQYVDIELVPWSYHYRGEGEITSFGFTDDYFREFVKVLNQELEK